MGLVELGNAGVLEIRVPKDSSEVMEQKALGPVACAQVEISQNQSGLTVAFKGPVSTHGVTATRRRWDWIYLAGPTPIIFVFIPRTSPLLRSK